MAAARKPKIVYYWTSNHKRMRVSGVVRVVSDHKVNWRLVGANGEVMCQSTQGFRDKRDARRSVEAVWSALLGMTQPDGMLMPRQVGPGMKPA